MLVKLTLTLWWNFARSNSRGRDRRVALWTPEFRKTQSREGKFDIALGHESCQLSR